MPIYRPDRGAATSLRRWRVAADPPPDPFEEKTKELQEEKPPAGGEPSMADTAIANALGKKADALLTSKRLDHEQLPWLENKPRVEGSGVDISYRLLDPNFKGAVLTVSWTKKGSLRTFVEKAVGISPDQLSLYFCDGIYLATAKQLEPFLKALATLQDALMQAGTDEEMAVQKKLEEGRPERSKEDAASQAKLQAGAKDARVMVVLKQIQSANASLDLTDAAAVLEAATSSYKNNNITKPQFTELQQMLTKHKETGAWKAYLESVGGDSGASDYRSVATDQAVAVEVQKLTDGLYKGKPQVGYYSEGDKNYVMAMLNAPFPFHFKFAVGGGNKLVLDGASARICLNDYSVNAPKAKDLLYADLALGIAARQASQVPDEVKNRGKKYQELSDQDEEELSALERELSGKKPKEKERGYQEKFQSKLYPIVFQTLLQEVDKDKSAEALLGADLLNRLNKLGRQETVSRADLLKLFSDVSTTLKLSTDEEKLLDVLDAVEGSSDSKVDRASRATVSALKKLLPKKKK